MPKTFPRAAACARRVRRDLLQLPQWPVAAGCALLIAAAAVLSVPRGAHAQATPPPPIEFNLPAQPLGAALNALSRQAGVPVAVDASLVEGRGAPAVSGRLTLREALQRVLAGSGLVAVEHAGRVEVRLAPPATAQAETALPEVRVRASAEPLPWVPPKPYAGGMVGDGQRLGILGNRDRMDTPVSTQSYTAELATNQQVRQIADVLANDTSAISTVSRYQGFTRVQSRGLTADYLLDGVPNLVPIWNPSLVGIERVEVLRGPAALFNGSTASYGTTGGSINFVPRRATDIPVTDFTFGYQSESTFYGLLDVGRRFGENKQWGVRLGAELRDGDSPVNFNAESRGALAIGADYRGKRFRASLDLRHQDTDTTAHSRESYVASVTGSALPSAPRGTFNQTQPWAYHKAKATTILLRGEYDILPRTTVFASYGYIRDRQDELSVDSRNLRDNGDFDLIPYQYADYRESQSLDVGLRSRFATGPVDHVLVGSYNTTRNEYSFGYFGDPARPVNNLYDYRTIPRLSPRNLPELRNPQQRDRLSGLTLADTLSALDDRAQLTVGVRRQQIESTPYDGVTGARTDAPGYDEARWSPGVGLVVRPVQWLSLYGNYLEGLASGGTAPATASNRGTPLPPIVSKQIEAGTKFDFGRVGGGLSLFQIEEPRAGIDPVSNVYGEVGLARIRGVEATVFGEPVRGVRILSGLTYLRPVLKQSEDPALADKDLQGTPRSRLVVYGEYDPPVLQGLTLTGRVSYFGESYENQANTVTIPSWRRLDLGARYSFAFGGTPLTARFSVENVADERYWVGGSFGSFSIGSPRTYLLSLSASF